MGVAAVFGGAVGVALASGIAAAKLPSLEEAIGATVEEARTVGVALAEGPTYLWIAQADVALAVAVLDTGSACLAECFVALQGVAAVEGDAALRSGE